MKLFKLNKNFAINPEDVVAVQLGEDLVTSVLISGVPRAIKSDYTFEETIRLLQGGAV